MRKSCWMLALLALLAAAALPAPAAWAQGTGTVTGQVVDQESRQPIPGAQVVIVGTSRGTLANPEGRFVITGVPVGTRTVKAIRLGYKETSAQVEVGATSASVTLAMSLDVLGLDEVVVVGYGSERRRNVAGAVSSIQPTETVKQTPITTIDNVLQGRVSGVQVIQNSGTPGGAMTVRVRGASSITAGNQPLYVVDGVPLVQGNFSAFNGTYGGQDIDALADLDPNDIQSIEVLKDASAAAIYGARASNGVVLITTKHGRVGARPEVTFNAYTGTQEMWRKPAFLGAADYISVTNEGIQNYFADPTWEYVGYADDGVDNNIEVQRGVNTDWIAAVTRKAPMSSLSASIGGGTEKTRYFVTGSSLRQDGVVMGMGYQRLNGRVNLDYGASDRVTLGTNVALTRSVTDRQRSDNTIYGPFANAIASAPVDPVYNPDHSYYLGTIAYDNPVALGKEDLGQERSIHILGNAFADYRLADGFNARVSVGLDQYNLRSAIYDSPIVGPYAGSRGAGRYGSSYASKLLSEATLNYSHDLDAANALSGVVGGSYERNSENRDWVMGTNFPSSYFKYLTSAATIIDGSSSLSEWNLVSYFGRFSWTHNDRLTATLNVRTDGSSRFGANNRYGVFPSASVLWRVSDEPFLRDARGLSSLALRASYGRTGNQQGIGNFAALALLRSGYNYADQPGFAPIQLANPDLSWERTDQLDLGFDAGFLADRFGLSFDYYDKRTGDLLLDRPIPLSTGFDALTSNIGAVKNTGYEISARARILNGGARGLTWSADLNLSHNRNEVTTLYNQQPIMFGFVSRVEEGQPIGVFYGYVTEGIFRDAGEVAQHAFQTDETAPGDIAFKDLNGDGVINADDRAIIGDPWPDFVGGITNSFSLRGFDVSAFVQFSQGNQIYNATRIYTDAYGYGGLDNTSARALERWTPQNPGATEPRAVLYDPNENARDSDRFVEDGSYWRLKNLVLGYTVPEGFTGRMGVGSLRVYLQAQNLWTRTDYSGFDPEVNYAGDTDVTRGTDFYTFPQSRTLTAGVNIRL